MLLHVCLHVCLQEGVPDEFEVVYVGSLSVDVDVMEQEVRGGGCRCCCCCCLRLGMFAAVCLVWCC
jgi:hypothetical protein